MRKSTLAILVLTTLTALACGHSSDNTSQPSASAAATPAPPPPTTPPAAASAPPVTAQKVEIEITSVANTMAFDKTKLTVPAGAEVHLVLKNHSTMKTLPHNWVLVQPGTQAKVAADGLAKAPTTGWIVEGPNVIAYTPLAQPGETTEVTFTAPAAGTYPYICTVPGHYMMMKGTLTVTP